MDGEDQVAALFHRLMHSQSAIGRLEAHNEILKLKLKLALQQLHDDDHGQGDVALGSPPSKARRAWRGPDQGESDGDHMLTPVDSESVDRAPDEHPTPKVHELATALSNLKAGFKRRETSLVQQLDQHKEALYALYAAHGKVQARLKGLCAALCMQMDQVERWGQSRESHSAHLHGREETVLDLQMQLYEAFQLLREMSARPQMVPPPDALAPGQVDGPAGDVADDDADGHSVASDPAWRTSMTQFVVRHPSQRSPRGGGIAVAEPDELFANGYLTYSSDSPSPTIAPGSDAEELSANTEHDHSIEDLTGSFNVAEGSPSLGYSPSPVASPDPGAQHLTRLMCTPSMDDIAVAPETPIFALVDDSAGSGWALTPSGELSSAANDGSSQEQSMALLFDERPLVSRVPDSARRPASDASAVLAGIYEPLPSTALPGMARSRCQPKTPLPSAGLSLPAHGSFPRTPLRGPTPHLTHRGRDWLRSSPLQTAPYLVPTQPSSVSESLTTCQFETQAPSEPPRSRASSSSSPDTRSPIHCAPASEISAAVYDADEDLFVSDCIYSLDPALLLHSAVVTAEELKPGSLTLSRPETPMGNDPSADRDKDTQKHASLRQSQESPGVVAEVDDSALEESVSGNLESQGAAEEALPQVAVSTRASEVDESTIQMVTPEEAQDAEWGEDRDDDDAQATNEVEAQAGGICEGDEQAEIIYEAQAANEVEAQAGRICEGNEQAEIVYEGLAECEDEAQETAREREVDERSKSLEGSVDCISRVDEVSDAELSQIYRNLVNSLDAAARHSTAVSPTSPLTDDSFSLDAALAPEGQDQSQSQGHSHDQDRHQKEQGEDQGQGEEQGEHHDEDFLNTLLGHDGASDGSKSLRGPANDAGSDDEQGEEGSEAKGGNAQGLTVSAAFLLDSQASPLPAVPDPALAAAEATPLDPSDSTVSPASAASILRDYQAQLLALQERDQDYVQAMECVRFALGEKLFLLHSDRQAIRDVAQNERLRREEAARVTSTRAPWHTVHDADRPSLRTPHRPRGEAEAASLFQSPLTQATLLSHETQMSIAQEHIVNLSSAKDRLERDLKALRLAFEGQNAAKMSKILVLQSEKDELMGRLGDLVEQRQREQLERARADALALRTQTDRSCQVRPEDLAVIMRPRGASYIGSATSGSAVAYSSEGLVEEFLPIYTAPRLEPDAQDALSQLLFAPTPTPPLPLAPTEAAPPRSAPASALSVGSGEEKDSPQPQKSLLPSVPLGASYEVFLDTELRAMDDHLQALVRQGEAPQVSTVKLRGRRDSRPPSRCEDVVSCDAQDFEDMRASWEARQLATKCQGLEAANKKLERELELYRTKLFTVISQDAHRSVHALPDVNLSYSLYNAHLNSHDVLHLPNGQAHNYQALYVLNTLVENNNAQLQQIEDLQRQRDRLLADNQRLAADAGHFREDAARKEDALVRQKMLLAQASNTLSYSEEDYSVLQKQVCILTKKMQLLLAENQQLQAARVR